MSQYLNLPADIALLGLPPQVTPVHVQRASNIIDTYCRRPEGLVWCPDYAGAPAWMANLKPTFTLTAPGAISRGLNVVVPVSPGFFTQDAIGTVLILDRGNSEIAEAVTISAVQVQTLFPAVPAQITLAQVANAHPAGATMDTGMVIMEERILASQRSLTRVSRPNFMRLIAGQGRFGYGRRSDQQKGTFNEVNLLATITTFGGPPLWESWDVNQAGVSPATGEVWIPASILLAYFTDVRIHYVAGFSASNIPDAIRLACATIATNLALLPAEMTGGLLKSIKAGDTDISKFTHSTPGRGSGAGNTLIDQNSMALLDPYKCTMNY